ncbi:3-oxoacyl-ACP synthase [Desulfocarbo indianensis]|nr:3-oxoacyl-ACP synthase [Desulfocarbo indianensis]
MRLKGKKAIVTGSSRGVGASVALAYGREGADVVVNYSSSEGPAMEIVKQIKNMGQKAVAVKADVAKAEDCQLLVDAAVSEFGGLDIVVNNAGFTRPAMLHKMDEGQWNAVLDIHLKAVWLMTKAAHPQLSQSKAGRVINVTSVAGVVGTVGQVNYSAAKGGVISLTKSIAREMSRFNTCANVVSLGIVATDMTEKIRTDEKLKEIYMNRILLKRFAEADDVTPLFVFLASDDAAYITGQLICLDGGYGMI